MSFLLIPASLVFLASLTLIWLAGFDQGHRTAVREMIDKIGSKNN